MVRDTMIILWAIGICLGIVNPMIALMCEEAKQVGLSDSIITNSMLFHIYRVVGGICITAALIFTALNIGSKKKQPTGHPEKRKWYQVRFFFAIYFIILVVLIELVAKLIIILVADTF